MTKRNDRILGKIFRGFIYVLPAVLFFSYYPVILFGANESMNFELSLPLIWLVLFDGFSFVLVIKEKRFGEILRNWKFLLLPVFFSLTILWSENQTRGFLTAGIFWLLYFAGFSIYIFKDYFKGEKFRDAFWKWFFGSAVLICVWCFLQCVLDLVGVSREYSLMCAGCTYKSFGFPHPNGFAIEPQFMGNLLLAPAIMSVWTYAMTIKQNNKNLGHGRSRSGNSYNKSVGFRKKLQFLDLIRDCCKNYPGSLFKCPKFLLFCFFIFTSTLFLTFSRGAIYAFGVALVVMTLFTRNSKSLASGHAQVRSAKLMVPSQVFRVSAKIWLITIAAFLFTLNVQGIMAQVSPTSDTYWSGVSKVLNHLSLGIIDVKKASAVEEATFDGYVAESTDTRMQISRAALQTWRQDFKTMMFGVGLGGAGEAMFRAGVMWSPKEIVQNEYVSLLLETGIVGVLFVIFTLWLVLKFVVKHTQVGPILTLMVAYGVSLVFFAGLPNALHIYIMPTLLMLMLA